MEIGKELSKCNGTQIFFALDFSGIFAVVSASLKNSWLLCRVV